MPNFFFIFQFTTLFATIWYTDCVVKKSCGTGTPDARSTQYVRKGPVSGVPGTFREKGCWERVVKSDAPGTHFYLLQKKKKKKCSNTLAVTVGHYYGRGLLPVGSNLIMGSYRSYP